MAPVLDASIYKQLPAPTPILNPLDIQLQGPRLQQMRAETEALRAQTQALREATATTRAREAEYDAYFGQQFQKLKGILESATDRPSMQRWIHLSAATLGSATSSEVWGGGSC